ncbi:MAG: AraC family transcriptional regulator [Flammeovirgaceae bacterium]|nr:AraC family transcriptional regulator [Flammeovirgaceae bacterium]MBE61399.1 AraC family transcriptional regulator [Flammeovirgaceae bacterium]HCX23707.1 AraC family transcriptional regulator [Cytophagales bacterium]|tara:strand:+ start:458 stop:1369 length:912 start_codon:yes stop_codon:yes gene_type:complete
MGNEIIHLKSVSEIHQMLGITRPQHPMITLLDVSELDFTKVPAGVRITMDLYSIWLKDSNCAFQYGRHHFDFDNGVLVFTGPGQVISQEDDNADHTTDSGWVLVFHPDLIRQSHLGQKMEEYTFFGYENHEALHLSENEEQMITELAYRIKEEYQQRIDNHSHQVINVALELLLSYCSRYYERQFNTRQTHHKDVVTIVEKELNSYINSSDPLEYGPPTISYLADKANLSPGYLSDLLKKETGKSGKDYINYYIVEKVKNQLLGTNQTINEVAYSLGFNYPHYFSRLFKSKTGMTPQEYRSKE